MLVEMVTLGRLAIWMLLIGLLVRILNHYQPSPILTTTVKPILMVGLTL
jgi:hypothetical protein